MRSLSNTEEQQAQHIACRHLVTGCEGAVTELRAATGSNEKQSPTDERAGEILAHVLSSWRDASEALGVTGERPAPVAAGSTLEGWTGDELFAEAVARSVGNTPALRAMQSAILGALIAAHHRPAVPE